VHFYSKIIPIFRIQKEKALPFFILADFPYLANHPTPRGLPDFFENGDEKWHIFHLHFQKNREKEEYLF
jgi:hypothetical protein